jgi:hypothetical protein
MTPKKTIKVSKEKLLMERRVKMSKLKSKIIGVKGIS